MATEDDPHEEDEGQVGPDAQERQQREKGKIVRIKLISIVPDNIQQSKITVLHRLEGVTGEWQVLFCKIKNEIFLQAQTKEDKVEFSQILVLKPEGRTLTIAKKYEGPYIPQVHLYSDRKIYSTDPKSNALEIRKCTVNRSLKFYFEVEAKYSTLPKVYEMYRLKNAVLIHLQNEDLCLTDEFGVQIKCIIKNLFQGQVYQDRSNPSDLYVNNELDDKNYRLNLFNNSSVSIPYQLLIKPNTISEYDHHTRMITYFESVENRSETAALSFVKIRIQYDSYFDFEHDWEGTGEEFDLDFDRPAKGNRIFTNTSEDVIQYMKRKDIDEIMSYNILHRTTFLFWAVHYSQTSVINKVIQLIDGLQLQEIPFLFPEVQRKNQSRIAFDMLIEKISLRQIIQSMLNVMVNCDPQGLLYQDIIERYLDHFIRYKINLKHYFESQMPIYEHYNFDTFPQYHENNASLFIPLNLDRNTPLVSLKHRYQELIHTKLLKTKHKRSKYVKWIIKLFQNKCCCKRWMFCKRTKKVGDDPAAINQFNERKLHQLHKNGNIGTTGIFSRGSMNDTKREEVQVNEIFQIEYNVVNMPGLISKNPKRFMQIIQENAEKDITFLDIPVIQMVVNFKWQKYTEEFFMFQFSKTLIFIISFLTDIIIMSPVDGIKDDTSSQYIISEIFSRLICSLIMIDHAIYEIRQLKKSTAIVQHFTGDFWNIFDSLIFLLYIAYIPMSFSLDREDYSIKSIQCSILFLYAIKFNFFLRIFDRLGFLVQMIVTVFYDLRYFLLYLLIIISFFSIMISIIMGDVEDHEGIGPIKYFVMTLRTSLGDNDIDQAYSEFKILFWIIWFAIMVVGNIVLMNFIIAVVAQSYDDCMAQSLAQSYRVKVDMIVEREQTMTEEEVANRKKFPQYILVRTPIDASQVRAREEAAREDLVHQEIKRVEQSIKELRAEMKPELVVKLNDDMTKIKDQIATIFDYIHAKVKAKEIRDQEEKAQKGRIEKENKENKLEDEKQQLVMQLEEDSVLNWAEAHRDKQASYQQDNDQPQVEAKSTVSERHLAPQEGGYLAAENELHVTTSSLALPKSNNELMVDNKVEANNHSQRQSVFIDIPYTEDDVEREMDLILPDYSTK